MDVIISPSSGSELVDVPLGVLDLVTPRDVVIALPGQLAVGVATAGVGKHLTSLYKEWSGHDISWDGQMVTCMS